jgi:hypothetical protein
MKEMSIRKVLGAREANLVYLLSKGFILLIAISAMIALPATQLFFVKYALDEYAVNAPSAWSELILGVMVVTGIALLMIGAQTIKVARSNPAQVLKNE